MADRALEKSPVRKETASAVETSRLLKQLLHAPAKSAQPARIDGVVVGTICGYAPDGAPLVEAAALDLPPTPATYIGMLSTEATGKPCAVAFQNGDPARPIVLGLMHRVVEPTPTAEVVADGRHVTVQAADSLELRCGQASITLTRDGQILLRGTYISNHSSGTQRIKGAAVRIN